MINLPLDLASRMANLMIKRLEGRVSRIEVAGSIRRERETVNNIDLVLIPKPDPQREGHVMPFFVRGQMVRLVNGQGSPERSIQFAQVMCRPVPDDSTPTLYVLETIFNKDDLTPEGIRINIAIASEANWGHCMMYRTGSRTFNEYLAIRANSRGLVWSPFSSNADAPDGLFDSKTMQAAAAKTEEEMFKSLKLKFVEPKDRERKS